MADTRLLDLPAEVLLFIFEHLDAIDSTCLRLTCQSFYRIHLDPWLGSSLDRCLLAGMEGGAAGLGSLAYLGGLVPGSPALQLRIGKVRH
jgi:hypothetical protein